MRVQLTSVILACVMLSGCDQPPKTKSLGGGGNTSQGQQEKGNTEKSYLFKQADGSCQTYNRAFSSNFEMCLGLQVESINNSCALQERKAYHKIHCGTMKWTEDTNPGLAEQLMKNSNGKFVSCTLKETSLPEITQFTSAPTMLMQHTSSRAIVSHSLVDGKISISMTLIDVRTNKSVSLRKVWKKDEAASELPLAAPDALGSPILSCLVERSQSPNLE